TYLRNNTATTVTTIQQPRLFIDDASATEGDFGTTPLLFTLRLTSPAPQPVTVHYTTAGVTASNDLGCVSASGVVTFPIGSSTQQLSLEIIGDTLDEMNETFLVRLSDPVNALLGRSQAVGTILDDDLPPTVSVSDVSVVEGNSGFTSAIFNVRLSAPSAQNVRVSFATSNGTATAGSDYIGTSQPLLFPRGLTS